MELIKLFQLCGTVLCMLTIVSAYLVPNYCCLKCGSRHVMCKYKKAGPGDNCKFLERSYLHKYEKKEALNTFNTIKNDAALGRFDDLRAFARNMRKLQWDDELEMMAVRWAEQCGGPSVEDGCRDSLYYTVGQIVYFEYGVMSVDHMVRSALRHQKCKFVKHRYHIEDYCLPNLGFPGFNVKNYAQGVWYENYKIGCALQQTNQYTQLICNFAPGAVQVSQEIATFSRLRSQVCDSCPNNTECMIPFPGLCAMKSEASTLHNKYFAILVIFITVIKY